MYSSIGIPVSIFMILSAVAVDVYHKEHLLTKEEFEDVFQYKRSLHAVLPSKDVTTVDRIAEILDKHGFVAKARDIRG